MTKNITNMTFGRLTAIEPTAKRRNGKIVWKCLCSCGESHFTSSSQLITGKCMSCGCLAKEGNRKKHGMRHSDEYRAWSKLRSRCQNPNNKAFKDYAGRGITVCERWEKFENFFEDMGPKPGKQYSVDRIDNSKGYAPENCRWATMKQQQRNRRSSLIIEFNGKKATLAEHCEILKLKYKTIHARVQKGIPLEDVFKNNRLKPRTSEAKPQNFIKNT